VVDDDLAAKGARLVRHGQFGVDDGGQLVGFHPYRAGKGSGGFAVMMRHREDGLAAPEQLAGGQKGFVAHRFGHNVRPGDVPGATT
jgi:hypothetical protein